VTIRPVQFRSAGEVNKGIRERCAVNAKGLGPVEAREHAAFVELLEKCLQLDPGRRITPNEALRSGFVVGVEKAAVEGKVERRMVPAMGIGAPRVR
ncbi:U4/U6 small nuclear ribonucleoprotein prp4, partial [Teratosphaeriaceae sp. CCFEE 6253]